MKKDKRTKGCPNTNCTQNKNKHKYKAADMYCLMCGQPLVFVCGRCFSPIDDEGASHKYCRICEQQKQEHKIDKEKLAVVVPAVMGAGKILVDKAKAIDFDDVKKAARAMNSASSDLKKAANNAIEIAEIVLPKKQNNRRR